MTADAVLFGGSGYVGRTLAAWLRERGRFERILLADLVPPPDPPGEGIEWIPCDVREPIEAPALRDVHPEWTFNLAAVHREPGHAPEEYAATNVPGAENVCAWAERAGCERIHFTSSISVYGGTDGPTDESAPLAPDTPYGESKVEAERIHRAWLEAGKGRRLVISRPGVIFGPGERGNVHRMVRALRRGFFAYPGRSTIRKSYGYVYGLCESVEFTMDDVDEPLVVYNYVEHPTEPLRELVRRIKARLGGRSRLAPTPTLPLGPAVAAARLLQALTGGRSPVHPVRVRKAATPTHIVPRTLLDLGFDFRYPFAEALEDWERRAPGDWR